VRERLKEMSWKGRVGLGFEGLGYWSWRGSYELGGKGHERWM